MDNFTLEIIMNEESDEKVKIENISKETTVHELELKIKGKSINSEFVLQIIGSN